MQGPRDEGSKTTLSGREESSGGSWGILPAEEGNTYLFPLCLRFYDYKPVIELHTMQNLS